MAWTNQKYVPRFSVFNLLSYMTVLWFERERFFFFSVGVKITIFIVVFIFFEIIIILVMVWRANIAISNCYEKIRINLLPTARFNSQREFSRVTKGRIFSEKYWYYFHCPKNVLCSILSFVFWIFLPLDTAVHLE